MIVEYLFAYPGIGRLLIDAVTSRDMPMVEAVSLILAAVYVVGNLIADIVTILSDPAPPDAPDRVAKVASRRHGRRAPAVLVERARRHGARRHRPARRFGPFFAPDAADTIGRPTPSSAHLFGLDYLGRDVLSRFLWGGRTALSGAARDVLGYAVGLSVGLARPTRRFGGLRCARATCCWRSPA